MCFASQRSALFRHLNFQKRSETVSFYQLWLGNVLGATMAYTCSTSQLRKVLRTCSVFSFFTSKCSSRHNGVQFFISHLTTWLRTRRFSEPTFRPSGATNHWTNTVNRDFPTFSRTCLFFLLILSPLWSSHCFSSPLWLFPPLLFHLSIFSEVWLLNFLGWVVYCCYYGATLPQTRNYFSLIYRWCSIDIPSIILPSQWQIVNKHDKQYHNKFIHVSHRSAKSHCCLSIPLHPPKMLGMVHVSSSSTPTEPHENSHLEFPWQWRREVTIKFHPDWYPPVLDL